MTLSIIIAAVAILIAVFLLRLAPGYFTSAGAGQDVAANLRPVDIEAFRNLIDPDERAFLQQRLPPAEFRKIQRERLGAAIEYVRGAAHNAAVLIRAGQATLHNADAETSQAARELVNNALRLRLYALRTIPRLYFEMLLPGMSSSPMRVAEDYEQITHQFLRMELRHPVRGISAA